VLDGLLYRFVIHWCRESVVMMAEMAVMKALVKRPTMLRGFVNGGIDS
jgi:hypothetical protein